VSAPVTTTGAGEWHAAPPAEPCTADERQLIRGLDWRFLLPAAPAGMHEHLVLLGGTGGLASQALALGVASRVSTGACDHSADCVVRLHDSDEGLTAAARRLRPGGLLYAEVDRRRPLDRATTPRRARRLLHGLGLTPLAVYWVRRSFKDRQLWLPLDAPGALSWYFGHLHHSYSRSWRERIVRAAARAAGTCAPALLEPWVRCYALVARAGADGARAGAVLEAPGMPREWRTSGAIVIAPRFRRVILFPFPQRARRPDAVVKVSRRPEDNERTAQEQRTLAGLSARLDDRLRRSVPSALGTHQWGALLVGVESCVPGRVLAHPRHPWTRMAVRTHLRHLRAVTEWLAEFHRQTRVRWANWDDDAQAELERTLGAYQGVFAVTPAEQRLFAHAAARGRAARGTPVPIVWRHGDLNPKNAYATWDGTAVVDWEEGREGLPLLDLLFFIEEWLTSFPAPQPAGKESSRYAQVFGSPDRDPVSRAVHSALRHYLNRTELAPALYPVLHLLLWTDAALRRFGGDGAAGQDDDIGRALVERYRGCVRALATGHSVVAAAEGGHGELTTWGTPT
jgi:hypothetical protein